MPSATTELSTALTEAELDRAFGALSDPTRRAILARLAEGDAGVLDVAAPFPMSQPAVTKHLGVLEQAGLISRHRLARRRMCHLEPQRLKQLSDWVGSYREFWEESFGRLDELLEELQGQREGQQRAKGEGT
jgi:DNA-binding transcriptional ArsR family regulator